MDKFQARIGVSEDIIPVLKTVCSDYKFGDYVNHKVVPVGYEDFNVILAASKGKYFIKIFTASRKDAACQEYVDLMVKVVQAGVKHPGLYKSSQGYLYQIPCAGTKVRLCVLEFIDGQSLYDTKEKISLAEVRFLVRQAAMINELRIAPRDIYDSWAIVNFLKEYPSKKSISQNSLV